MKTLYYPTWQRLEIADLPRPIPGPDEVLLRVAACGICGSELDSFREKSARRTPPLIMGHEFCGEIVNAGSAVSGRHAHEQVIAHSVIHCGQCAACERGDTNLCESRQVFGMHRPGAFAEYVCVPERVLINWSAGLAAAHATLVEPLANGINALRQGKSGRHERVVVIGAGPIGLMCALAALRLYASDVLIADLIPERLDAAQRLGVLRTVNPSATDIVREVSRAWSGKGASHVIDAVGSARTKALALELAEAGGTVVWLGLKDNAIQIDSYSITLRQLMVAGSYAGSIADLKQAADLLTQQPPDLSWVTTYPLDKGETAFYDMLEAQHGKIKGILQMHEGN